MSLSMTICGIAFLIVCTILSAQPFYSGVYAAVTLASVPLSYNAFFHKSDQMVDPGLSAPLTDSQIV